MRFHRTTNSGNNVVGTRILVGNPTWIEVELVDLPQVVGRGIIRSTQERTLPENSRTRSWLAMNTKSLPVEVHHRVRANVHGASVDEDCTNAGRGPPDPPPARARVG